MYRSVFLSMLRQNSGPTYHMMQFKREKTDNSNQLDACKLKVDKNNIFYATPVVVCCIDLKENNILFTFCFARLSY